MRQIVGVEMLMLFLWKYLLLVTKEIKSNACVWKRIKYTKVKIIYGKKKTNYIIIKPFKSQTLIMIWPKPQNQKKNNKIILTTHK